MKTICFSILLLLFILPSSVYAGDAPTGRYTKKKRIEKIFTVSPNVLLEIDNSYGNIDITTWDQNRIEIEVTVLVNGNDEEKVQERLREIDVLFEKTNTVVRAETLYEREDSSSWWNIFFGNDNNVNIEINYRVKAPITSSVNLDNDYGSILINKLRGDARISCDYGRLLIGELLGENNQLSFDYTRNSSINYVKRAKIDADYSEFSINEAGTLDLNADYSESHIGKVENIKFNCDYGNIRVDKVRNVNGQGDYIGTKFGQLYNTLEINMDYGSILVEEIMKGLEFIDIDSDYTSIKIGYNSESPFSYNINTSYGDVEGLGGSDFEISKRHQSSGDNFYEGYYLSETMGGKINIDSSYGNISFEE